MRTTLDILSDSGLGPPEKRPEERWKELPEDVTRLTSRQLGRYYQGYVAFAEYAEHELAVAECRHKTLTESLGRRAAILTLRNDEAPKWRLEALFQRDRKYVKYLRILTGVQAKVTLLKSVVERYNRRVQLISREITRRQDESNPKRNRIR